MLKYEINYAIKNHVEKILKNYNLYTIAYIPF